MQGAVGKVALLRSRYLQRLELVLFELERVLVNGNDRIELFAGCALTRDEPAFLGALDHERRVELALFGTPVDAPKVGEWVTMRTAANVWGVAGTGLGFSRSLALRPPSTYDALVRSERRSHRSLFNAALLGCGDLGEFLDLILDLGLDIGHGLPLLFIIRGALGILRERLQLILLEPDRLLVHGNDRLQLRAGRTCGQSNEAWSAPGGVQRFAERVRVLQRDGGAEKAITWRFVAVVVLP